MAYESVERKSELSEESTPPGFGNRCTQWLWDRRPPPAQRFSSSTVLMTAGLVPDSHPFFDARLNAENSCVLRESLSTV
jgi:hypothetical protein